jgi:DNA-binding transcriptional ArsR family regulator
MCLRGSRTKSQTDVPCVTGLSGGRTLAQRSVLAPQPMSALQTPRMDEPSESSHLSQAVDTFRYRNMMEPVARSSTTSDVFNAIAEARRREILDVLITGEKAVGAIVNDLSMSQPQVSKHLRVLSEVGLVRCRAEGRRRLYRLEPARLRPLHEWLAKYEQAWNDRLDRVDDYLKGLQRQGE